MRNLSNLYIDGVVGIGTTSPLRKLHITGDLAINANGSQYYGVYINGVGEGANPNILIGDWHNSSANITWDSTNNFLRIDAQHSTSGAPIVFSGNDAAIEYGRFTATGNFGIGTTSPSERLDVDGKANIRSTLYAYNGVLGSNDNATSKGQMLNYAILKLKPSQQNSGTLAFAQVDTGNSIGMQFTNGAGTADWDISMQPFGGRVGIGDVSPSYTLDVAGTGRFTNNLYSTSTSEDAIKSRFISGAASGSTSDGTLYLQYSKSQNVSIGETSTGGLHVAGNVGIGTTSPAQKLEVNGGSSYPDIRISATGLTSRYLEIGMDSAVQHSIGAFGAGTYLTFKTVGTDRMVIDASGNVGIGTASPSTKLHVYGDLSVGGDGSDAILRFIETTNGWTIRHVAVGNRLAMSNVLGGTDHFNILETGEVGIGTTSPAHKLDVTGGVFADYFQLDTAATPTPAQGMFFWDADEDTVGLQVNGLNYELGQGLYWAAKNQTGSQIDKGTPVYASGTLGASGRLLISPMIADGSIEAKYFLGLAAEDIANGTDGKVITQGKVRQLDTSGYGAAGNVLWVSASTAGQLTHTKPTGAGDIALAVAFVVDYASNGSIATRVSNLDENIVGVISTLDQVTTAGNTTNNDVEVGGLNVDSGTLYVDSTNNRVGIGTTSPAQKLDISQGSIFLSGSGSKYLYIRRYDGLGTHSFGVGSDEKLILSLSGSNPFIIDGGNVGIGTSSPGEKLDVAGNIKAQYNGSNYSRIGQNSSGGYLQAYSGAVEKIMLRSYGDSFINGGNVGIGTTTPSKKLDIVASDSDGVKVSGGTNGRYVEVTSTSLDFYTTSVSGYGMANLVRKNSDGSILGHISGAFGSADTLTYTYYGGTAYNNAAMYILSSNNNVGIGTTSPSTALQVNGVITATGGNSTNWNTAYSWGDHSTQSYATQTYVNTQISNLVDSAPSTLDTLNELAAALGDDPNFATTVTNSIASKVPQTRTLTINGTAYDLSADRSWTITSGLQASVDAAKVTTAVGVGTTTVATIAVASYDAARFEYVVKSGLNLRSGTIMGVWDGTNVQFTETTTNDIGVTTDITFTVAIAGANAELRANSGLGGWTVKVVPYGI